MEDMTRLAREAQATSEGTFCPICRSGHNFTYCEKWREYIRLPNEDQAAFLAAAQGDRRI